MKLLPERLFKIVPFPSIFMDATMIKSFNAKFDESLKLLGETENDGVDAVCRKRVSGY